MTTCNCKEARQVTARGSRLGKMVSDPTFCAGELAGPLILINSSYTLYSVSPPLKYNFIFLFYIFGMNNKMAKEQDLQKEQDMFLVQVVNRC